MAAEIGQPPMAAIQNAPELADGEELFLQGFRELDTCRSIGLGKGPIPWTAIHQYCEFKGFDYELASEFHLVIRLVDGELLHIENEEAEAKRNTK